MAAAGPSHTPPPLRRLSPGVAGLFSLLVFASLPLVPILGALLALLSSLPLVHLSATGRPSVLGWGWVLVGLVGVAFLGHSAWLVAACVGYLVLAAWPAWSVEVWARRQWSDGRWLALVAGGALSVLAAFLVAAFHPAHPAERLTQLILASGSGTEEVLSLLGGGRWSSEQLLTWAANTTAYLAPSLGALYVVGSALWLRPRLPAMGLPVGKLPFSLFTSEDWLPLAFAVGGLGWVFTSGIPKWLAANLLATVAGLYFVHGLAIIHFYLGRRLAGNRWVRLAVAFVAVQMPLAVVVAATGLVDTFFRLRRTASPEGGSDE